MDWYKWISAALLLMMIIYIFPRAKHMLKNSPKGETHEWMGFAAIIGVVTLFIVFLIMSVR
jgi:cytosine/uracil/thiamine/allantoin permease